ncbi:cytochrome P450 [Hypomontagnella monticulosa]|nr:cytochrome P450 [Hypomontagnella monticulosa]
MTLQDAMLTSLPSHESVFGVLTARHVFILICGWLGYHVLRALWNISPFHPLSHIPGPKLAAATYLPEFWHDVVKFGRYTHEIKKMHEIYGINFHKSYHHGGGSCLALTLNIGPIVRINPEEIHCNDIHFVNEISPTSTSRKREKSAHNLAGFTVSDSAFGTIDHDLHRMRRGAMARLFSKAQIVELERHLERLAQHMCDKLLRESERQDPIDLRDVYSCFTADVISEYCFGESWGFLAQESWLPNFRKPMFAILNAIHVLRFFPFLNSISELGLWFPNFVSEDAKLLAQTMHVDVPNMVKKAQANLDAGIPTERPTIFNEILTAKIPLEEKSLGRLVREATLLLMAGTETVAWTLTVATVYLLSYPDMLSKLTEELRAAVDDPQNLPSWSALEKLPYLSGVIQESLRLSHGASARVSRVPTEEDLVWKGSWKTPDGGKKQAVYVLPRGYSIGTSNVLLHQDESIFPDSLSFKPERWLDENMERRKDLDRYQMAFQKGSRGCIGLTLALCELHLVMAVLVLRVFPKMRLYETTIDDVEYDHDLNIAQPSLKSKGVKVIML